MKRIALFAGLLMIAPLTVSADPSWDFKPTDAFQICHERALDETPMPRTSEVNVSDCMATQELAHVTTLGILSNLQNFNNPILEVLIPVCRKPDRAPTDWIDTFECMTALQEHGGWEEELPPSDDLKGILGNRQTLLNVGTSICLEHPRFGKYAFFETGTNERTLFLGSCVNPFANALEAWEF